MPPMIKLSLALLALAPIVLIDNSYPAGAAASEAHQRVACKQALKARLRDPRSLDIPWGGIVAGDDVVKISYRAKNGFGGVNSSDFYCEFNGTTLIRTVNN